MHLSSQERVKKGQIGSTVEATITHPWDGIRSDFVGMAATSRLKNESQCKSRMNCDLDPAITLSQRRDVAVLNSSWREKKFMDEGLVTLWCAVYGEATVFSVTIARDVKVGALQKAIVNEKKEVNERFKVDPSLVTLYLAKKDGAWLKDDDDVEEFLRGEVDKTYKMMRPSWTLDDVDYFGGEFKPGEEEIHILVELPPAAAPSLTSTSVKMDDDAEQLTAPYEQAAERLKDAPTVSQLVAAVRYVAEDTQARPFIVLESSSGMGKTQMAFNLMARDEVETHYVVCAGGAGFGSRQGVYTAFDTRAVTFLACIERDLKLGIGHGEVMRGPMGLRLHTFEFVRALLSGADKMASDVCAYEDVREVLKSQPKQPVVFIDEFPSLIRVSSLVPSEEILENEVKLRFMRNVFRTLNIPVILSSTNGTARNMIETGTHHSREETDVRWCVVVPELPRFQDPATTSLARRDMAVLVEHSRPLFARFALDYMRDHELPRQSDDQQTIKYMDGLTGDLADKSRESKRSCAEWFREGQVCLFLAASYYESTKVAARLIHGHYARLQDPKMLELRFRADGGFLEWDLVLSGGKASATKRDDPRAWKCRTMFPPLDQDVLLYLSLTGGKTFRPFRNGKGERISFCEAFEAVKIAPTDVSNPVQPSNDGMHLEAMAVAAIVSASHCNGFAGIPLDAFLLEMVYELGMGRPESADVLCELIPSSLRPLVVPFLAPPNVTWPEGLPSALKLGTITRTKNADRLDLRIDDGWLTGECKDYGGPLKLGVMKKILERIPPRSKVHLVVTNQLQGKYFQPNSFTEYLQTRGTTPLDLTKTRFLRCGSEGTVQHIIGMETSGAPPDRLVLFVARRRNLSTTAASGVSAVGDETVATTTMAMASSASASGRKRSAKAGRTKLWSKKGKKPYQ